MAAMMDLYFLGLLGLFALLSWGLLALCDSLTGGKP
jgi:hypothetical protein